RPYAGRSRLHLLLLRKLLNPSRFSGRRFNLDLELHVRQIHQGSPIAGKRVLLHTTSADDKGAERSASVALHLFITCSHSMIIRAGASRLHIVTPRSRARSPWLGSV